MAINIRDRPDTEYDRHFTVAKHELHLPGNGPQQRRQFTHLQHHERANSGERPGHTGRTDSVKRDRDEFHSLLVGTEH